jgi:hypothetical protein
MEKERDALAERIISVVNRSQLDVRDQVVALMDALRRHPAFSLLQNAYKALKEDALKGSPMPEDYRWMAEILYRNGKVKVEGFEELYELHDIIEHGPDWNSIDHITVTLNRWSGQRGWDL